jgi:hypothetical protein
LSINIVTVTQITRIQHIDHRSELGRTKRLKFWVSRDVGQQRGAGAALPSQRRFPHTVTRVGNFSAKGAAYAFSSEAAFWLLISKSFGYKCGPNHGPTEIDKIIE